MASFSPKTPKQGRGLPVVRHVSVSGHQVLEVRIPILGEGPKREEVWVAELPGKNVIWWDQAGARDVDGETAQQLVVNEKGIGEFQTVARLYRCDGVPAHCSGGLGTSLAAASGRKPLPCQQPRRRPSRPTEATRRCRQASQWVTFTFTRLPVQPEHRAMFGDLPRLRRSMTMTLPRSGAQIRTTAGANSSPPAPVRDLPSPVSRFCPAIPAARRHTPPRPGPAVSRCFSVADCGTEPRRRSGRRSRRRCQTFSSAILDCFAQTRGVGLPDGDGPRGHRRPCGHGHRHHGRHDRSTGRKPSIDWWLTWLLAPLARHAGPCWLRSVEPPSTR